MEGRKIETGQPNENGDIEQRYLRFQRALAAGSSNTLAMLRRRGESLIQRLTRLDQAIAKANDEDVYTDEINGCLREKTWAWKNRA
jgi:hypothetical protein